MRVEPYTIGSYVHVIKRGARGLNIVRSDKEKYRFLRSLYYMNDTFLYPHWEADTKTKGMFHRPTIWPGRDPLVEVLAYTLLPNHFHLILREVRDEGLSRFMKKVGQSMTNYMNEKYKEQGSIFQGSYRSRTIDSDEYLRYVAVYVMTKNTFEIYPNGGLRTAQRDFDAAWDWAVCYPFSSLGSYVHEQDWSPVLTNGLLRELFTPKNFRALSRDVILGGKWKSLEDNFE